MTIKKVKKILITGGGGFLGKRILELANSKESRWSYEWVSFSRNFYHELEDLGIEQICGDLTSYAQVKKSMEGCDAIIHCASKVGMWGDWEDFYQVNVEGTKNIIKAMKEKKIPFLVYTSTPSVVMGTEAISGEDESYPYPKKTFSMYGKSKRLAEEMILAEGKKREEIFALSLRPHLIWGPGDKWFLPRFRELALSGKLKRVGKGQNLIDVLYIDNAAMAHLYALDELIKNPEKLSGEAYFLGQDEKVSLWEFVDQLLEVCHISKIQKSVSYPIAFIFGAICEFLWKLGIFGKREPPMTRYIATIMAKDHYFSHKKAEKHFLHFKEIGISEGLERLRDSLLP